MEIIIGRDAETGQLRITTDGKVHRWGDKGSVRHDVSREHCRIVTDDTGLLVLKNLNNENETFVNGLSVEQKNIQESDRIELGASHYLVGWDAIKSVLPRIADIRPLKNVWMDYQKETLHQQIAERRFATLRSATGLITMVAIALSIFTGRDNSFYLVLYGAAIVISVCFTIKAYRDAAKSPIRTQQLREELQRTYVCPQCGHFLGMTPYDVLVQSSKCPYCSATFKK